MDNDDLQKCLEASEESANLSEKIWGKDSALSTDFEAMEKAAANTGEVVSEFLKSVGGVWGKEVVEQATFGTLEKKTVEEELVEDAAKKFANFVDDEIVEGLKEKSPLHLKVSIAYEVWESEFVSNSELTQKMDYNIFYALGTHHKMQDKTWKVKDISKNIMEQCYEVTFIHATTVLMAGANEAPPMFKIKSSPSISALTVKDSGGKITIGDFNMKGTQTGRISMAGKPTPRVKLFSKLCHAE